MKRNYGIDVIKLLLAISIALGHFSHSILSSGIVVTLFFVLSGYFLMKSFESGKYQNPWQYTLARVKRIYPYYLFAFVVLFVYIGIRDGYTLPGFGAGFASSLPELFMVQNSGIFIGGINYPLWQLCTLIIVSHIFFSLLKWNKQLTANAICPVLAIAAFTYLANASGNTEPNWWGVEYRFIYIPLLRAAGSLSIGIFLFAPVEGIINRLKSSKVSFLPAAVTAVGCLSVVVFWINKDSYSSIIPFMAVIICLACSRGYLSKLFRFGIFSRLDKLSLGLYLNHALVIHIIKAGESRFAGLAPVWVDVIYIAVLLVYSVIMLWLVDLLTRGLVKLRNKLITKLF